MNSEEDIKELIQIIQVSEGNDFENDETAILNEYNKQHENKSSLTIKILSIIGGFLATIAFLGFLFIAGLYDSEIGLLLFGIGFIVTAIWLNKTYDKLIIDTLSISIYVIGFFLLGFGLLQQHINEDVITISFLLIALCSLIITQTYILSFISVLIVSASLLTLMLSNNFDDFIHLYNTAITLVLTYFIFCEAKIITASKKLSKLYNPIRIGLIISLLFGLGVLGKNWLFSISENYIWVSSISLFFILIYLVHKIIGLLEIKHLKNKILIYTLSILVLSSTVFAPAILGATLIILLCYLVNYKTGLTIGVISLVYFVSQYYYDLNFTLLTKSIILFSSGILFLAFYLFTHKKTIK